MIFGLVAQASAHVVVRPAEAVTSGFVTFTVSVPNERETATVALRLDLPEGLENVLPTVKPGWTITTSTEGGASITWSAGSIPAGFRDDFTFSAKVPAEAGELRWNAYQTYADGVEVAWDKTEDEQPKTAEGAPDYSVSGPFSVTKVVAETEAQARLLRAESAAAEADKTADRALYIAIVAVLFGLGAVIISLRKSS